MKSTDRRKPHEDEKFAIAWYNGTIHPLVDVCVTKIDMYRCSAANPDAPCRLIAVPNFAVTRYSNT